ncbi:DUF4304 domain-containing protein [Microlunatus sagamiharensis]|nr:DUF4304 domain-containing protein [Microlunatus sagamiharensis]
MKTAFAPFLRERGFRGSSGRFELPSDTHWAQLGFQKSAYSDRAELRFTINLSVISRNEWAQQLQANPHLGARPTPTISYGSWADQTRIGMLIPPPGDKWWRIIGGSNVTPVRDDVLTDLDAYAIPWIVAQAAS